MEASVCIAGRVREILVLAARGFGDESARVGSHRVMGGRWDLFDHRRDELQEMHRWVIDAVVLTFCVVIAGVLIDLEEFPILGVKRMDFFQDLLFISFSDVMAHGSIRSNPR